MTRLIPVLLLAILGGIPCARADLLQQGYQARYAVSRNGLPLGESVRVLRRQPDGRWSFDAHTRPTGLIALFFSDEIDEHSELRIGDQAIVPLRYRYDRHGGRKPQLYTLRFDWDAGQLILEHSDRQLPLAAGTQDPLSFVLAVMQQLARQQRDFPLAVAGRKRVRDYRVQVTEQATLDTVLGEQRVVRVQAVELGEETRYDLWCLPAHDYLPLRVRQQRKDETTELRLRALASPPPPTAP